MNSNRFNRSALLSATSLLALAAAAPVYAQTAAPGVQTTQEIVVTGFRASLQSALQEKRKSNLPIESVAPEDIGKMPDTNVAESLQRLPGVQIDRSDGYGTQVLIDGLRYNLTTLNGDTFLTGKEFYTSGEAGGGGGSANVQYNSLEGIPSEEIGGIDVYKNPQSSITEGGIGGTIDLKSRDPLSAHDGLTIAGNVRGTEATGQTNATPSATLVGTYKVDSSLAVTGSISYDETKTLNDEYEAYNRNNWIFTQDATNPPTSGPLTQADIGTIGTPYIIPGFAYFTDQYITRDDLGASLGLKWKMSDAWTTNLLWFYSNEENTTISYSNKVDFNSGQATATSGANPGLDPADAYSIGANGVLQSATFNATGAETATLYEHSISQANNFQWKTGYDAGGALRATFDVSYSKASNNYAADQADVEHGLYNNDAGTATSPGAPGCNGEGSNCAVGDAPYTFTWNNGGTTGKPSAGGFGNVLTNPAWTTFKSNWAWAQADVETEWSAKADFAYDLPDIFGFKTTIEAGARLGERNLTDIFGKYLENDQGAATCCLSPQGQNNIYYLDPGYVVIPYSTATSTPSLALSTSNWGTGTIIVKNPVSGGMEDPATYLNSVWNGAPGSTAPKTTANNSEKFYTDTLSSFRTDEKTTAGYVMADFGGKGDAYHLNLGVRAVQTNLTVTGAQAAASPSFYGTTSWNGVNSNNVPVQTVRTYTDVLPSLNFTYDISETLKFRFGAAKVVAPQDLAQLGDGNSYNFTRDVGGGRVNTNPASKFFGQQDGFQFVNGQSGNAKLDPYRASQESASLEDYFAKGGLLSVGFFGKQIDSFEAQASIPTFVMDDFGGTTGLINKPINAGSGTVYGVELGGQYAFDDKISPWLEGFGVAGNYTYSSSSSHQTSFYSNHLPIPGVSTNAVNVSGYYEKNGFSARLSYSWRSKALNDGDAGVTFPIQNLKGVNEALAVYQAPYGQLDGQVGYDFNKHFGIVFSVQNLTNEAQHTYVQWPNEPLTYDDAGTRYFLGFKFKN